MASMDEADVKKALNTLLKVASLTPGEISTDKDDSWEKDKDGKHKLDANGNRIRSMSHHGVKKSALSHVRAHLDKLHKKVEGPRRYRKMIRDFTFTSKKGKKFTVKKGDHIAVRKATLGKSLLQLFRPYKIFTIDSKQLSNIMSASEAVEKDLHLHQQHAEPHAEHDHPSHKHAEHDEHGVNESEGEEHENDEGESDGEDSGDHEHASPASKGSKYTPDDFRGEDEHGHYTAKLDVESDEFTRNYHDGTVISGIKMANEDDPKMVKEDIPDLPRAGGNHFIRTYSPKKRGSKKDGAAEVKITVPTNTEFFTPKDGDILVVKTNKYFEGGPCSYEIIRVSSGYASVLHNGEILTFPVSEGDDDEHVIKPIGRVGLEDGRNKWFVE